MALTDEQRNRIEENRKRALEIKRRKQLEREGKVEDASGKESSAAGKDPFDEGGFVTKSTITTTPSDHTIDAGGQNKKRRVGDGASMKSSGGTGGREMHSNKSKAVPNGEDFDDDESSLEEFEIDAPPHITQTEAQRTYCVPLGTLEVCSHVERDNPRGRGWSKMKLYSRAEVRRRARRRFGGKDGLIAERERRKRRRHERDLREVKDVFG